MLVVLTTSRIVSDNIIIVVDNDNYIDTRDLLVEERVNGSETLP